jgi:crotonobetainyl-CoA:carnitine CoA-transferase CaiB-like acyl-CoA transferase
MTALLEREASGEGQWVSTSLLQAQIFMLDFQAARFLTEGQVAKQAGNNHPTSIPTGVFKTKDGYLNIAVTGTVIWERFCNAVDHPEWITAPDYKNGKLRSQNRDALNADIDSVTATKTSAEWVEIFNKVGVPCGPIYTIDQVFADPQVKHLGMMQESARSDGSRLGLVGQPFKLSRTPSKIAARPPDLSEHTDEILSEFGFSADEIKALHESKAV